MLQESVGLKANLLRQWDNGSYFLNSSLHRFTMHLKIKKSALVLPLTRYDCLFRIS